MAFFKNPVLRTQNDTYEITPKTGMMALWPSYLMHGSGDSINKSSERIVLSFNTFFK